MNENIIQGGFDTRPIVMEPFWLVAFQAPEEDIDRIFSEVLKITPLVQGKTDSNAFRHCGGIEYYRPLEGAPTGAEDNIRRRPKVDEMRFFLPRDLKVLKQVVETIYEVHSYYEPVISVMETLRSTGKGLDDSENPHRWWNKDGDWKDEETKN